MATLFYEHITFYSLYFISYKKVIDLKLKYLNANKITLVIFGVNFEIWRKGEGKYICNKIFLFCNNLLDVHKRNTLNTVIQYVLSWIFSKTTDFTNNAKIYKRQQNKNQATKVTNTFRTTLPI